MRTLHLGCGKRKESDAVGVDLLPHPGVDIVHDLDVFPYPIESGQFDRIIAMDVLEHLENFVQAIEEIHRVSRHGAEVIITGPFAASMNRHHDPTHRRGFTRLSMDYFIAGTENCEKYGYSNARFERTKWGYGVGDDRGLLARIGCKLANKLPAFYERNLSYVVPMDHIHYILKAIKE